MTMNIYENFWLVGMIVIGGDVMKITNVNAVNSKTRGVLSSWSSWSTCSGVLPGCRQSRSRHCTPRGKYCSGDEERTGYQSCTGGDCRGAWSPGSSCSGESPDCQQSQPRFCLTGGNCGDSSYSCGLANNKSTLSRKRRGLANALQGGVKVEFPRKYPWNVLLRKQKDGDVELCGGSIINDRHILTAAHCFYENPGYCPCHYGEPIAVYADIGEHDKESEEDNNENYKTHSVKLDCIFIHPEYVGTFPFHNDIAILRLSAPIHFNDVIRPICLPEGDSKTYNEQVAKLTGWGRLSYKGSSPSTLQEVDVPILDTTCGGYESITANQLCAGVPVEGGKGSCQGDSGGPLAVMENGKFVQVGVVSWGRGCAEKNNPTVYTRISKYLTWINTTSASGKTCLTDPEPLWLWSYGVCCWNYGRNYITKKFSFGPSRAEP